MNAPDDVVSGLEPAVLGSSLGSILGEVAANLIPAVGPSLPFVLASLGQGALIACIAFAFGRRVDGLAKAAHIVLPGLLICVLLLIAARAAGGIQ